MDDSRFDDLTRCLAVPSRRSLFAAVATAIGAALFGDVALDETLAKRTKRKRTKRKRAKMGRHAAPGRLAAEGRKNKKKRRKKKKSAQSTSPSCTPTCVGKACGAPDGCGGACQSGSCPAGQVCQSGQCGSSCDAGWTVCGDQCVNTQTNANHCGACNTPCQQQALETCGTTGECSGGTCVRYDGTAGECQPPVCVSDNTGRYLFLCDGAGTCRSRGVLDCGPTRCRNGRCSHPCASDDDCISNHYCGEYPPTRSPWCLPSRPDGGGCDRDGMCTSGFCVGGVCCSSRCDPPSNARPTCPGGTTCAFTCQAGFADCDDIASNGCETDLTTTTDCGQCGNNCLLEPCGPGFHGECQAVSDTYRCVCVQ